MKVFSFFLAFVVMCMSSQTVMAKPSLIPTIEIVEEVSLSKDRDSIVKFMEQKHVQEELIKRGIAPHEAIGRVASLSREEVKMLSSEIQNAPAGGDGVGTLIGAAVFIFVVLLITDILGFTKIFPFTRSIN